MFVQPDPRQFPQAGVHSMVCFLRVHRGVLQSAMQLQLITRSKFSGAGARYVCIAAQTPCHIVASPTLSDEVHQQLPSLLGLAVAHEYSGTLLLLMLVVALVDEHETCSMRPSHRTADAEGSPGCQSSFQCIVYHQCFLSCTCHISCLEAECVCSTLACCRNELND